MRELVGQGHVSRTDVEPGADDRRRSLLEKRAMSPEKPDQIQASVAAALSRLRGDLGPSGATAPKIEEQPGSERTRPANDVRGDPFFRTIQSQQPIPMTPFPRMQAAQTPAPESADEEQGVAPEQGEAIDMPEMPDMPEQATSYDPGSTSSTEPISSPPIPPEAQMAASQAKAPGSVSPFARVLSGRASPEPADVVQPDLLAELPPPPISEPLTADADAGAMRRRRRNRRLLALAAIIIVAAIGAWWWTGRTPSTDVPVITADATPEKVKPAEEGGLQVQNQDVQVLDPSAQSQAETVMPEPEQPITPPAAGADQAPTVVDGGQAAPAATAEAPAADTQPAPGVPLSETPLPAFEENGTTSQMAPAPAEAAAPVVAAPEPTQTAEAPAATEPAPAQSATEATTAQAPATEAAPATEPAAQPETAQQQQQEPTQAAQPQTTQPAQPEAVAAQPEATQQAAATPTAPTPAAATGNTRIQLAAGKSEASVQKEWAALQKAYPQQLGDLSLTIERVDKGTAGVFYRLQAGPLADKAAARQVCASLKQHGQDCIVVGK
jgi:hypothetical protein